MVSPNAAGASGTSVGAGGNHPVGGDAGNSSGASSVPPSGGVGGNVGGLGGVGGTGGDSIGGGAGSASAAPWTCMGAGMALQFDGDQIDEVVADLMGDMPAGDASRTIEMWAYTQPKTWRMGHPLFDIGTAGGGKVLGLDFATKWENSALVQDGYPSLNIYSDKSNDFGWWAPFTPGSPNFKETGWVHFAVVYNKDTTNFAAIANGETVFEGQATLHGHLSVRTEATPIHIGFSQDFGDLGFDGKIDELRIWNRARTNAEIKSSMHSVLNGDEAGLVGYWHFDEGAGTVSRDFSPGHHDAVMSTTTKPVWVKSDGLELVCP